MKIQTLIRTKFLAVAIIISLLSCRTERQDSLIVGLWVEKSKLSIFEGDTISVKIPPSSNSQRNNSKELKSYVRFSKEGIYNQLTSTKQPISKMEYEVQNDTLWISGDKIPIINLDDRQLIIKESTAYGLETIISYERVAE